MTNEELEKRIKGIIADLIGVDPEDVNPEDTFENDLSMSATELTELSQSLQKNDIDVGIEELAEFETVSELIEHIASEEIGS